MNKKALVIVAHPDDEVIGVGGTILKLQKEYNYEVRVEFLTTSDKRYTPKWDYVNKVSKILGTTWDHPTYRAIGASFKPLNLDTEPISELVDHIESVIEYIEPEIVFTHHIGDINQDHRAVSEAVLIATRPYPGQKVKKVYTFNTLSSTEWSFGLFPKFEPNVFLDISDYIIKKREAMMVYKEEILNNLNNHPRSIENIERTSKQKASIVGLDNVETFHLVRSFDLL